MRLFTMVSNSLQATKHALTNPTETLTTVVRNTFSIAGQVLSYPAALVTRVLPQATTNSLSELGQGVLFALPTTYAENNPQCNYIRDQNEQVTDTTDRFRKGPQENFTRNVGSIAIAANLLYLLQAVALINVLGSVLLHAEQKQHISLRTRQFFSTASILYMSYVFLCKLLSNNVFNLLHGTLAARTMPPTGVLPCDCKANPDLRYSLKTSLHGITPQLALLAAGTASESIYAAPIQSLASGGLVASSAAICSLIEKRTGAISKVIPLVTDYETAVRQMLPGIMFVGSLCLLPFLSNLTPLLLEQLENMLKQLPVLTPVGEFSAPQLSTDMLSTINLVRMALAVAQAVLWGNAFVGNYLKRAGQCSEHVYYWQNQHKMYSLGVGIALMGMTNLLSLPLTVIGVNNFFAYDAIFASVWGMMFYTTQFSAILPCRENAGTSKLDDPSLPQGLDLTKPIRNLGDSLVDLVLEKSPEIKAWLIDPNQKPTFIEDHFDLRNGNIPAWLDMALRSTAGQAYLVYLREELLLVVKYIGHVQEIESDTVRGRIMRKTLGIFGISLQRYAPEFLYGILKEKLRTKQFGTGFQVNLERYVTRAEVKPLFVIEWWKIFPNPASPAKPFNAPSTASAVNTTSTSPNVATCPPLKPPETNSDLAIVMTNASDNTAATVLTEDAFANTTSIRNNYRR